MPSQQNAGSLCCYAFMERCVKDHYRRVAYRTLVSYTAGIPTPQCLEGLWELDGSNMEATRLQTTHLIMASTVLLERRLQRRWEDRSLLEWLLSCMKYVRSPLRVHEGYGGCPFHGYGSLCKCPHFGSGKFGKLAHARERDQPSCMNDDKNTTLSWIPVPLQMSPCWERQVW